ncbi:MAG: T9SS type A sorting domain-containing protein [Bacteroidetes bacterium]|nr:T9SS type A sorting domain-containing protein [Bacteroidota bacterium]
MKTLSLLYFLVLFFSINILGQTDKLNSYLNNNHYDEENIIGFSEDIINNYKELLDLWKLDSIIIYNVQPLDSFAFRKTILTYDDLNNKVDIIGLERWGLNEEWYNTSRNTTFYNNNNMPIKYLSYDWEQEEWRELRKNEYVYNDGNQNILRYHYRWDTIDGKWFNVGKYEFGYNEQGINNLLIYSTTDAITNNWIYFEKKETMFSNVGLEEENITQQWDSINSVWNNYERITFTYDDDIRSHYRDYWVDFEWKYFAKSEGYWIDNETVMYNSYTYRDDSAWVHTSEAEIGYDGLGNIVSQESYRFLEADSLWIGEVKFEKLFDELGRFLETTYYKWEYENNEWIYQIKYQNGYNNVNIRNYNCSFSWYNDHWIKEKSYVYYYTNIDLIGEISLNYFPIQVNPNPCVNQITLDFENRDNGKVVYSIYTQSGELIDEGNLLDGEINVANFNTGIYFLRLSTSEKTYSGKFVKL